MTDEFQVRCPACASSYPLRRGVIDLRPEIPTKRTLGQATMESDTVVRLYESRLWRRSMIAALALGISFDR